MNNRPSAVSVITSGVSCRSPDSLAFARSTGICPVEIKVAVVNTMTRRTSMTSTSGMTLIWSSSRSMATPVDGDQFTHSAAKDIVHHDAWDGDKQAGRSRFQCQTESDHDRADSHGADCSHRVKGQHDAEDGAQETDVRGIRSDRADDDEASCQSDFTQVL